MLAYAFPHGSGCTVKGEGSLSDRRASVTQSAERTTLNFRVYEALKTMIIDGRIPPGSKLNETRTAQDMGTSATPVREAFRMLATEGLVRIEPWKGVVVPVYQPEDILELFQCREQIECLAMSLTLERLRYAPDRTAQLDRLIQHARGMRENATSAEFSKQNAALHSFWIEGSGNRRLIELMGSLQEPCLPVGRYTEEAKARRRNIVQEHQTIVDSMLNMNVNAALSALRQHLDGNCRFSIDICSHYAASR